MKRALCGCLVVVALALTPLTQVLAVAAQQPRPGAAAQDEFVPVRDLPAAEQLPAAPLVIAAYAFIWVATLAYVWFVWRRLDSVERELASLRRELGAQPAPDR